MSSTGIDLGAASTTFRYHVNHMGVEFGGTNFELPPLSPAHSIRQMIPIMLHSRDPVQRHAELAREVLVSLSMSEHPCAYALDLFQHRWGHLLLDLKDLRRCSDETTEALYPYVKQLHNNLQELFAELLRQGTDLFAELKAQNTASGKDEGPSNAQTHAPAPKRLLKLRIQGLEVQNAFLKAVVQKRIGEMEKKVEQAVVESEAAREPDRDQASENKLNTLRRLGYRSASIECEICRLEMHHPIRVPCPGKHYFCQACIVEWLDSASADNRQATCPKCRAVIMRP